LLAKSSGQAALLLSFGAMGMLCLKLDDYSLLFSAYCPRI